MVNHPNRSRRDRIERVRQMLTVSASEPSAMKPQRPAVAVKSIASSTPSQQQPANQFRNKRFTPAVYAALRAKRQERERVTGNRERGKL